MTNRRHSCTPIKQSAMLFGVPPQTFSPTKHMCWVMLNWMGLFLTKRGRRTSPVLSIASPLEALKPLNLSKYTRRMHIDFDLSRTPFETCDTPENRPLKIQLKFLGLHPWHKPERGMVFVCFSFSKRNNPLSTRLKVGWSITPFWLTWLINPAPYL